MIRVTAVISAVSETEPYEPYTDNKGRLFRECQKEYGRCVSSVYMDTAEGTRVRVLTKVLDASPFAPKRRLIQRAIDRALTDFRARQAASPSPCLAVALAMPPVSEFGSSKP